MDNVQNDLSRRTRAHPTTPLILFVLVVLGTLVRLSHGLRLQGWLEAPDALAWGLVIDEAAAYPIRYYQLVHWPHEGASALFSCAALVLRPIAQSLPPLSMVALLVDTISRAVQVTIA